MWQIFDFINLILKRSLPHISKKMSEMTLTIWVISIFLNKSSLCLCVLPRLHPLALKYIHVLGFPRFT